MNFKKIGRGKKIVIGVALLAAIGGGVYFNLKQEKKKDLTETIKVKRGSVVDKLTEVGSIQLVRTIDVKSTVSGEIISLGAEAGDFVHAGQVLAVIAPDASQTLQLYNNRSAVRQGQADLEQASRDLERKKKLMERKLISLQEVEQAQQQFIRIQNTYRLNRLELEMLETKANITHEESVANADGERGGMDNVRILSPASGIVTGRPVEVGEVVVSGISTNLMGTEMFQIGDPSELIVKADISEVDVGKMRAGLPVNIVVDAYPDTTFKGAVLRIAPVGKQKQGTTIVSFETEIQVIDRDPRLRQGMSCDIDVVFSSRDSTLFLPVEAALEVFGQDEGKVKGKRGKFFVYRKEGEDFVQKEVTVGLETGTRVEVTSGLGLDDEVAADAEKMRKKKEEEQKKKEREKKTPPKAENKGK
ncbi:MAG: efflux RND transporter periplasmic adaptor subunit [Candidatus Latescibacteria bacterium]|nr:efflux RND transporter periplasmic adaptor subunit [Candidatus Latescibacterota bacterium]